jgi:hypothetical protein
MLAFVKALWTRTGLCRITSMMNSNSAYFLSHTAYEN